MDNVKLKIKLDILTPERQLLSKDVDFLSVPGGAGSFGVLPHHIPLVSTLNPGILSYQDNNLKVKYALTGNGFIEIDGKKAIVLAEAALKEDEIDVSRAMEARKRAEERLSSNDPEINKNRARSALIRAMVRLKTAGKL